MSAGQLILSNQTVFITFIGLVFMSICKSSCMSAVLHFCVFIIFGLMGNACQSLFPGLLSFRLVKSSTCRLASISNCLDLLINIYEAFFSRAERGPCLREPSVIWFARKRWLISDHTENPIYSLGFVKTEYVSAEGKFDLLHIMRLILSPYRFS